MIFTTSIEINLLIGFVVGGGGTGMLVYFQRTGWHIFAVGCFKKLHHGKFLRTRVFTVGGGLENMCCGHVLCSYFYSGAGYTCVKVLLPFVFALLKYKI